MLNKNNNSNLLKILLLVTVILCNWVLVISQPTPQNQSQEQERDAIRLDKVSPEEFAKNRVNPKAFRKRVIRKNSTTIKSTDSNETEEVASLGFTLWKLRKSQKDDSYRIGQVIGIDKDELLTPERVESKPITVEDGDLIKFAVELPVKGYLYVFDREEYPDGSHSAPYLVYPLKGVNNLEDNNLVEPNKPVYLPRQKDSYCIRVTKGDEGKIAAEVYTFLVTPEPLNLSPVECKVSGKNGNGETIVHCPPREVKKQEFDFEAKLKEWSAYTQAEEFNLKDPKHQQYKTMEKTEIECSNDKISNLTAQSPPPQIVYTIARKATQPYMVSLPIYIRNKEN